MGRGCVDPVFVIKQMIEKCIAKGKSLFVAYMDLEKLYDRVDRIAIWRVLNMSGVNAMLVNVIRRFYIESKARVRV